MLANTFKTKVLLIDDQPLVAETVRSMIKNEKEIEFYYCENPTKALQYANEINPTLILQDLVMPEVDGLVLVKFFRANPKTKDIPLIVLSTKEEPTIKAEAFAYGANDYLVKLPDKIELIARIKYHSAAYIRLLERNEAYARLAEKQKILNAELMEAAAYVRSLLPAPLDNVNDSINTQWFFLPSMQLGGDAFGYHWLDDKHFAVYLLDVCGHGVGAALLSISVVNVLRSQTLYNTEFHDPASVLRSLNATFPMEKHNNMFFTIWYGVYNCQDRVLRFSSGGHPPALLLMKQNGDPQYRLHELGTHGLVIGAMPDVVYNSQSINIAKDSRLLLYSDGVFELPKPDGKMLQLDEYIKFIEQSINSQPPDLETIVNFSKQYNGPGPFQDDFSILEVNFK
jgi:phosphoserine phosphatase RsbU/P